MLPQGELSDTVKALDLGVQAAESELEQASAAAEQIVKVSLTARPEAKAAAPQKRVGSLKNSAMLQQLQSQMGGGPAPVLPNTQQTPQPQPLNRPSSG